MIIRIYHVIKYEIGMAFVEAFVIGKNLGSLCVEVDGYGTK